jgi:hypothetical protein
MQVWLPMQELQQWIARLIRKIDTNGVKFDDQAQN